MLPVRLMETNKWVYLRNKVYSKTLAEVWDTDMESEQIEKQLMKNVVEIVSKQNINSSKYVISHLLREVSIEGLYSFCHGIQVYDFNVSPPEECLSPNFREEFEKAYLKVIS